MEAAWQSAVAIAVAAMCGCVVIWRLLRPFLKRPKRPDEEELLQIEGIASAATVASPGKNKGGAAADNVSSRD